MGEQVIVLTELFVIAFPFGGVLMVCYGIERLRNSLKQRRRKK